MQTFLDRFGRVLVPKRLRVHLGLEPGAMLHVEEVGDGIVLKPVRDEPSMVVKDGVLVFTGKATAEIADSVRLHREKRLRVPLSRSRA